MRVLRVGPLMAAMLVVGGMLTPGATVANPVPSGSRWTTRDHGLRGVSAPLASQFVQASGTSLTLAGSPYRFRGASIYGTSNPGGSASASQVLSWAAAAHLNTIRLVDVIDERGIDDSAPFDETNWVHVDQLLADISAHGMVAVLDLSAFRNHLVNRDIRLNGWQGNCLPGADRTPVDYSLIDPYRVGLASEWQTFIDFVSSRVNTVTGIRYRDDPTIAVISLAGEPQPPASQECGKATDTAGLTEFYRRTLEMLRLDDANHLRSSGGLIHTDWQQLYGSDSGIDGQAIFALADNTLPALHTYPPAYAADGTPIDYQTPVLGPWATSLGKPWFTEEFGWTQDVGDSVRASRYDWLYNEQSTYGSAGALFWNLGPEVAGASHDANPSTPLTWSVIVARAERVEWTSVERVSVDSSGQEGTGQSYGGSLSADGRYVAFMSSAALVSGDTNGFTDIFVRDRQTNMTERVSVAAGGGNPNQESYFPQISADGRYVAFESLASNLVPNDTNGFKDVFVYDRSAGTTERVSVASDGTPGNDESNEPSISADGRFVAFYGRSSNLVAGDTNGRLDVFVHDRTTGVTELVSIRSDGQHATTDSFSPVISDDGRLVALSSTGLTPGASGPNLFIRDRTLQTTELASVSTGGQPANDTSQRTGAADFSADDRFVVFQTGAALAPGDTNGVPDVYLRNRQAGTTERISLSTAGAQGSDESVEPSIRADGRIVVFESIAPNLVPGDTNGTYDVFARDRLAETTERISVTGSGDEGAGFSGVPAISADGSAVVFRSRAANLVAGDTNGQLDVLVRAASLTAPGAPTGASAIAGNGNAMVSWSAPDNDGASAITAFTVMASPGGAQATAAGGVTSATVSGLTNGTPYTFTVTATNAIGTGPGSNPSSQVTPVEASSPGAPTSVTAAAGDGQASVSWMAPASDGGSPISSYTVTAAPGGSSLNVGAATLSAMFNGLANGAPYTFTVTATNGIGTGPASNPSDPVTPVAGAPSPQTTTETVPPAGGSATTDPSGTGPTATDPVTTSVTVPATTGGGSITVAETAVSETAPSGYAFLGQQVDITSTAATSASNPLTIVFTIDTSALLAATGMSAPPPASVDVTRAETGSPVVIGACTSGLPPIAPDPCVSSRQYDANGDLRITILTGTASHWNTAVKPIPVTVTSTGYSPKTVTVAQGAIVAWTFSGTKPHSATDNLKLGPAKAPLFNSGALTNGRYGTVFLAAGTYTYNSTVKGDPGSFTGSVAVPVLVSPSSGGSSMSFSLTWSSSTISGYVFDVQYRFMKAGSKSWSALRAWKTGVSVANGSFSPTSGLGTYAFSARLRNAATGKASLWSPEAMIVVH